MKSKAKIIRDVVHGYIPVDDLTEKLINTYNFQRLKDIRQLTAQYVYPSATHNRFEHSLGVMYLAVQAFNSLRPIFQDKGKTPEVLERLSLHFTVAALLHDIGHAPFSHLGEYFYPPEHALTAAIQSKIRNIEYTKVHDLFSNDAPKSAKHELMSCYVILSKYQTILQQQILKRRSPLKKTFPGAFVDWDNSARKRPPGFIVTGASPEKYEMYMRRQIWRAKNVYNSEFLFINAWNEWAEGTYLEPDKRFGLAYLEATYRALE